MDERGATSEKQLGPGCSPVLSNHFLHSGNLLIDFFTSGDGLGKLMIYALDVG